MKKITLLSIFVLAGFSGLPTYASQCPGWMIHRVVARVQENIAVGQTVGHTTIVTIRKLDSRNQVTQQEVREYRTIWIQGRPFGQLVTVNQKPLSPALRVQESRRKSEFIKALQNQKPNPSGITQELQAVPWIELYKAYDFVLQPPDDGAANILKFAPVFERAQDRTRFEKILHRMSGTIWLDQENNVMQAIGHLTEPVRFGWGIFARVDELEVRFRQQKYQSAWVPAQLYVRFKARVAMFKTARQEVLVSWSSPYPCPDLQTVDSSVPNSASGRDR